MSLPSDQNHHPHLLSPLKGSPPAVEGIALGPLSLATPTIPGHHYDHLDGGDYARRQQWFWQWWQQWRCLSRGGRQAPWLVQEPARALPLPQPSHVNLALSAKKTSLIKAWKNLQWLILCLWPWLLSIIPPIPQSCIAWLQPWRVPSAKTYLSFVFAYTDTCTV